MSLVICGAPGAGKTLIGLLFLQNLKDGIFVDGQVEIPGLKSFFSGKVERKEVFKVPVPIRNFMLCASCGLCAKNCPFGAIYEEDLWIDPLECEGCGLCAQNCPQKALTMANMQVGEWQKISQEGKVLLSGQLLPGALGASRLAEHLLKEALKLARKPMIIEASGNLETQARLLRASAKTLLVLEPDHQAEETLERFAKLSPSPERFLLLNRDQGGEREEDLINKAQELGYQLLARIPFLKDLDPLKPDLEHEALRAVKERLLLLAKA